MRHWTSCNIPAVPTSGRPLFEVPLAEAAFFQQPGIAERLRQEDMMTVFQTRTGAQGITHRHYQQYHAGLRSRAAS
ncbi:MAG: hypothetical protein U0176_17015 [Bacteroidia bacterium]